MSKGVENAKVIENEKEGLSLSSSDSCFVSTPLTLPFRFFFASLLSWQFI